MRVLVLYLDSYPQNAQLTEIIHRMREDMEVMQQAMSSGTEKHPRHVYKSINHQQQVSRCRSSFP